MMRKKLEPFDPAAQEPGQLPTARTHTQSEKLKLMNKIEVRAGPRNEDR
jgi:hypothetical protein